ncbi:MAG: hypothetical protein J0I06_00955 [Planctomycetes bacterium]|nr:hypothetical protein [Planctomycetota bacterium]
MIEYTHDDPNRPGCGQRNRLLTDLLCPDELPAAEAPVVYHERWEQELAFDELKTHLSGRDVPIRSKTPAGVVQEVYGLVLAYYLIRRMIHDAAVTGSVDPDRVSFTGTLRVLWRRLPDAPGRRRPTGIVTSCGRYGGSGSGRDASAGTHVWSSGRCRAGTRSGRSTSTRLSRPNPSAKQ